MICGIDEAGRGPVIGPLVVAGITLNDDSKLVELKVKDSKKITPRNRTIFTKKINPRTRRSEGFFKNIPIPVFYDNKKDDITLYNWMTKYTGWDLRASEKISTLYKYEKDKDEEKTEIIIPNISLRIKYKLFKNLDNEDEWIKLSDKEKWIHTPIMFGYDYDFNEIKQAVIKGLSKKFKTVCNQTINPYGNGKASEKIVKILEKLELNEDFIKKKLTYDV